MKLVFTATVENLSTRQDGTIKVSIGSQEMTSEEAGKLFYFRGKYCKVLLTDDNISNLESDLVSAEQITGTKKKTQSQRLRAVLYRAWEQSGLQIEFEDYYRTEMERLIDAVKQKLE